ncbi:hypothetical protein ACI65C_004694 [Semiaphis heraclei]
MDETEENCELDNPCPQVNISLPWPLKHSHVKTVKELLMPSMNVSVDVNLIINNCLLSYFTDTLNQMIQDLIINASLPFNIVSHVNFKDIISKGFPGRNLLCRQTLMKNIDKSFNIVFEKLKCKLNSVEHLTTSADAWSTFKRSYLGITVHWIEDGSLERKSYLLSIKRLTGSHTYEILARSMESLDNNTATMPYITFIPDDVDDLDNCTVTNEDEDNDFQDISHLNIAEVLEDTEDEDIQKAISGVKNAVSPLWKYKQQSRTTFAKLTNLWNKQNRSTKIADVIKSCFGVYLVTPTETRWNSTYDSVNFFLKKSKLNSSKLFRLCDEIDIVRFNKNDMEFLEEYSQMMEPLAIVLDLLQGEKNMFFGFLIPSITELIYKYEQILNKNQLKICSPLVAVIINSIEKRFEKILSDQLLTTAAISHPYFKTVWIKNQVKKDLAISDFKKTVLNVFNSEENDASTDKRLVENSEVSEDEVEDSSFFSWSNDKLQGTSTISVENEKMSVNQMMRIQLNYLDMQKKRVQQKDTIHWI